MSKKLENNGLWESSRMMLPQHREAFVSKQKAEPLRPAPILHDDEYELMIRYLKESYYTKKMIDIDWLNERRSERLTGCVEQLDENSQRIKMKQQDGSVWIPISLITGIRNHSSSH